MAEPAFEINTRDFDYYNDNTARRIKEEPLKEPEIQPDLKKVTKEEPRIGTEARRAISVKFAALFIIALFAFGSIGVGFNFICEKQEEATIRNQELRSQYDEIHSQLEKLRSDVKTEISEDEVIAYVENELGWKKIPDSHIKHADLKDEPEVVINE